MKKLTLLSLFFLAAGVFAGCSTPNERFQRAWYSVAPRIKQVRKPGRELADFAGEFHAQLDLAERYGGARIVYFGDSNAEYAARRRIMRQFNEVAVNLGIGGTATDDWVEFFESPAGQSVLQRIRAPGVLAVLSIGGNDILQNRRRNTAVNFRRLRTWLPNSLIILIPAVHSEALQSTLGRRPAEIRGEIRVVNALAGSIWQQDVIDTETALRGAGSTAAAPGILRDAVHYSPAAFSLIIRTVNEYFRVAFARKSGNS